MKKICSAALLASFSDD